MRRLQNKHKILITLNAIVWSFVGLAWTGTIHLSATNMTSIEILSEPARIRLLINGTPWANGAYVTTPLTIPLPVGQNRITMQRTGYHSNTSTVVIQSGKDRQKVSSVLEASVENQRELTIEPINETNLDDVEVSIDSGLEKGNLPLTITDIVPGSHTLEITTGAWNKRKVNCQFEVPLQGPKDPLKITVERIGKKLKFAGCKRAH